MGKFSDREEIPAYLLDQDFFKDCLQDRRMAKSYGKADPANAFKPCGPKPVPDVKTPAADKKPAKETKPVAPAKKPVTDISKPKQEVSASIMQRNDAAGHCSCTSSGSVKYRVQIYALSRQKPLVDLNLKTCRMCKCI
ncbi:MAG: hypothetical protein U0Z17_11710 [Bacteroidales bacterium]